MRTPGDGDIVIWPRNVIFFLSQITVINVIIMMLDTDIFFSSGPCRKMKTVLRITCILLFQSKLLTTHFDVFLNLSLRLLLFYWLLFDLEVMPK